MREIAEVKLLYNWAFWSQERTGACGVVRFDGSGIDSLISIVCTFW